MIVCSVKRFGLRPRLVSLFLFAELFAFLLGCLAFASHFLSLGLFLRG